MREVCTKRLQLLAGWSQVSPRLSSLGCYKFTAPRLFKSLCVVFHGQLKESRLRETFNIGTPQRSQRKSELSDPFFLAP